MPFPFVRRQLHVPRHRATTAHLCSVYPFLASGESLQLGVYLGTDILSGGGAFSFDPFESYRAGLITNPNMLFAGEPGVGKSTTVKVFVHRSVGILGRWVAIVDPKGEYGLLADALGLDVIKLYPGGPHRINPLDPGPDPLIGGRDELIRQQTAMITALVGSILRRELTPIEDATLGLAITQLARTGRRDVTLKDVAAIVAEPTREMADAARTDPASLSRSAEAAFFALGKLIDRSLRGMFDGVSNVNVDWRGPGLVLDLSSVHHDPDALALVMVAATSWLQASLARPDHRARLQVLDEAWSLLSSERTSRYLQSCWKLGRSYGVANVAIVHRLSDLRAQADDGTATAKVSMGLLADTQTRVLFRQSTDQVPDATKLLGLTSTEAAVLPRLVKGRALWKVGPTTALVAHAISAAERSICDTDAQMAPS